MAAGVPFLHHDTESRPLRPLCKAQLIRTYHTHTFYQADSTYIESFCSNIPLFLCHWLTAANDCPVSTTGDYEFRSAFRT
ncbi:uncharacterized protein METZ01_LOCUS223553 [marine metagenome]|uniref:Uncharacterized protein n=1 Tax=marine metagenome TaxID=408172 RepID=A0A382G710_9ZZZZ